MNEKNIVNTTKDLGLRVRYAREKAGLTQAKVAGLCRVGIRFISELENGKATLQTGKVLSVIQALGMHVLIEPKGFGRG
jgi:HTH-type transcriptional regulator/antitoxin HipB